MIQVAVIGGGAAGFFSAISAKEHYPAASVVIFEKSDRVLSKVGLSGGGRCNVTNNCGSIAELCSAYPRGGKSLKKAFHIFNNRDTKQWFESRGVPLVVQDDQRIFPASGDAGTIVNCLIYEAKKLGIEIKTGMPVRDLEVSGNRFRINFDNEDLPFEIYDKVIVTTGGSPHRSGLDWLEKLGHKIEDPVPSLFTFNMPGEDIRDLMGVTIDNTLVRIQGTKLSSGGSLLITHWGMSGPAILKLSSFGARILHDLDYRFNIQVNWSCEKNNEKVFYDLEEISRSNLRKKLVNHRPYGIPVRLWQFILMKADLPEERNWGELGKKSLNKLVDILTNDVYRVNGRTTFKDEFVTCGGVSLESVDMSTLQSKACENLYFAGEVLDIDAITGGYNLQAAWTTGWIAGQLK